MFPLSSRPWLRQFGQGLLKKISQPKGEAVDMRYTELKTWEDFAKALSQEQNPARLTYLVEGLNRALGMDERKDHPEPLSPSMVSRAAKHR